MPSPIKALPRVTILLLGLSSVTIAQPAAATQAPWPASSSGYYYTLIGFVLLLIVGYIVRRAGAGRRSFRR